MGRGKEGQRLFSCHIRNDVKACWSIVYIYTANWLLLSLLSISLFHLIVLVLTLEEIAL